MTLLGQEYFLFTYDDIKAQKFNNRQNWEELGFECSLQESRIHNISTIPWFFRICFQSHDSENESYSVVSDSLRPHALYSPWNSPDQNTGVSSFPFSRGSTQPKDQAQVSCIADSFFTSWATGEDQKY